MTETIAPTNKELTNQVRETVKHFASATVFIFVILIVLISLQGPTYGWGLATVALGLFGVGAVTGFLYSTFGDEKEQFSPVTTALTSALGGAGVADGLKDDGQLRHLYHALGNAAGLAIAQHGTVLAVMAIFTPLGFFTLYFYRKLVVNPLQRRSDSVELRQRQIEANRTALSQAGNLKLDTTASNDVFAPNPAAQAAAVEWLKREPPATPTFDDLLGDARAQIAVGKYAEAITALNKALLIRSEHPLATLLLAAAYVASDNHKTAVGLLDALIDHDPGQAPLNAWKLLGFALLFHPPGDPGYKAALRRSIEASTKYLTAVPNDSGALLNRACAYAQLGPVEKDVRTPMFKDLQELFRQAPAARENVRALLESGQDFAAWAGETEFKDLLTVS